MGQRLKVGMTFRRIILLALSLTFIAQVILFTLQVNYAGSLYRSIQSQKSQLAIEQLQKHMIQQLDKVNHLLLLLHTPEFTDFFKNFNNFRDESIAEQLRLEFNQKMEALQLSSDIVESIYFIGFNESQWAYRKDIGSLDLVDLAGLRMDSLQNAKLESLFLSDYFNLTRYERQTLQDHYDSSSLLLRDPEKIAIESFLESIEDRFIMTNGNINNVFVVIVLNEQFFSHALPTPDENVSFGILDDAQIMWSSSSLLTPRLITNQSDFQSENVWYTYTAVDLLPYQHQFVYIQPRIQPYPQSHEFWKKLLWVALVTLLLTFLISYIYLRKMFKPFKRISRKMNNKLIPNNHELGELSLQPIPDNLRTKGFQSISLRSKLILLFFIAVSVPLSANGFLYSQFLTQEVAYWIEDSVESHSHISAFNISQQAVYMENIAGMISASRQLHDYLINPDNFASLQDIPLQNRLDLRMFPGLSDVSYFVLLNAQGESMYSSIYSNNNDIFRTDLRHLRDSDEAYWIAQSNIFNDVLVALVKKLNYASSENQVAYLLLVPKETIFSLVESEHIRISYNITDFNLNIVHRYQPYQPNQSIGHFHFEQAIPDKPWNISFDYYFRDVALSTETYQEQFLLLIISIFLLSAVISVLISYVLIQPINQLKETMAATESTGVGKRLFFNRPNEINDIINSYNSMIIQLEETIKQNMNIMEENTRNKIRENELISKKSWAELQMLQAQINPHFLYNTLTNITMLSQKRGHDEITRMVTALADLLRYSISISDETALLDKELKHAANYVTIQQVRFANSFSIEYNVAEEARQYYVLRFILQPIIENSIMHGFEGWESGGKITISVAVETPFLVLKIQDNGIGMESQQLDTLRKELVRDLYEWNSDQHIGLKNVYYRLHLFYKGNMKMEINSQLMAGTEVAMIFPIGEPD